jgi:hypothetical protein
MRLKMMIGILFSIIGAAGQWIMADTLSNTSIKNDLSNNTVLIIKGGSDLENRVAKIVTDNLTRQSLKVELENLRNARRQESGKYLVVIVFNAIKKNNYIDRSIHTFLNARGMPNENVLVFSVYGRTWPTATDQQEPTDAITAATRTLNPSEVAQAVSQQVISTIRSDRNERTSGDNSPQ